MLALRVLRCSSLAAPQRGPTASNRTISVNVKKRKVKIAVDYGDHSKDPVFTVNGKELRQWMRENTLNVHKNFMKDLETLDNAALENELKSRGKPLTPEKKAQQEEEAEKLFFSNLRIPPPSPQVKAKIQEFKGKLNTPADIQQAAQQLAKEMQ